MYTSTGTMYIPVLVYIVYLCLCACVPVLVLKKNPRDPIERKVVFLHILISFTCNTFKKHKLFL